MDLLIMTVEQGLIYAIMALGVYITYKILDFPDLTVDGSFPLGAAVTAALLKNGVAPILTLPLAFLAGALAGICTGLIHVKCKVQDLLSGVIMMTALYTFNLMIAGANNVPLFSKQTIFSSDFLKNLCGGAVPGMVILLIIFAIVLVCKIALDLYMKTKSGYLLRAVGGNEGLVTALAKDKGNVKILGLAIANGLVALSGSVFCQEQNVFDISMGPGALVFGLASVIIGISICRSFRFIHETTAVLIGAIIYKACVAAALRWFPPQMLKLITAVLFLVILVLTMERKKKVKANA